MESQSKALKAALKVIKDRPGVFKALEEFEKTGKTVTKSRLNFTLDREIAKRFREYCIKNHINMSKAVEDMIKTKFLK